MPFCQMSFVKTSVRIAWYYPIVNLYLCGLTFLIIFIASGLISTAVIDYPTCTFSSLILRLPCSYHRKATGSLTIMVSPVTLHFSIYNEKRTQGPLLLKAP